MHLHTGCFITLQLVYLLETIKIESLQINNNEILLRQSLLVINRKRNVDKICWEYIIKGNNIHLTMPWSSQCRQHEWVNTISISCCVICSQYPSIIVISSIFCGHFWAQNFRHILVGLNITSLPCWPQNRFILFWKKLII